MKIYLTVVNRGTKGARAPMHIAPLSKRYLNKFYWNAYRGHWDKIVSVDTQKGQWGVVKCNSHGIPNGVLRHHDVELDARCFADKPFNVRSPFEGGSFVEVEAPQVQEQSCVA